MSQNIKEILGETMEKVKSMASADTIIGDPIVMSADVTCVPISRVSYGFASGGSDFGGKKIEGKSASTTKFGGGGGAGMSITPVAFLVLQNGKVNILNINEETSSAEKAISMIPDVFDKLKSIVKKDKSEKEINQE